jgi:hypothetical protein
VFGESFATPSFVKQWTLKWGHMLSSVMTVEYMTTYTKLAHECSCRNEWLLQSQADTRQYA